MARAPRNDSDVNSPDFIKAGEYALEIVQKRRDELKESDRRNREIRLRKIADLDLSCLMRFVIVEKYKYIPIYVDGRSKNYIEQYRESQKKDLIRRVSNLVEVFPDTIGVDIYFNKISSQAKLDISNVNTKEEEAFEYYLKIGANVEF